jgi:hypothetical protein
VLLRSVLAPEPPRCQWSCSPSSFWGEATRLSCGVSNETAQPTGRGVGDTKAAERVVLWGHALFEVLLPQQESKNMPVLLACDDESVRVAATNLGFDVADPSAQLGRDIAVAFEVGRISGWKRVVAAAWEQEPRPRPLPPFFPVLCLWVLAASRMAPDDHHPTSEYHGRLCNLVGIGGDDSLPYFNLIGLRFRALAEWLAVDLG